MPFNPATGTFTRTSNSFSNPVLGTEIDPTDADGLFDDYDAAFNSVGRIRLTANTSFFVNASTGSDSNSGLSSGAAWATIGKAVLVIRNRYDIAGFAATVNVAAGTYNEGVAMTVPWVGLGSVVFTGDTTTPTNVVIDGGTLPAIDVENGCVVLIQGFSVKSTSSQGIQSLLNARVTTISMDFGVCGGVQAYASRGGYLELNGTNTVHGNAANFIQSSHRGEVRAASGTITWTADSTYSLSTIYCDSGEIIGTGGVVISAGGHTVTGTRFALINSGLIQWNGLTPPAPTDIPGTVAGTYNYATETISLAGTTSGTITHAAAAVAGTNTITWPAGTTDFSATGGTGRFVKQNSAGAALTVSTVAASEIASGAALSKADDTNVTLALTGTPTTALLAATTITAGWTGTLASARLNANVVQAITNDTNVTGSIATQTLTLGWTGSLAVNRGGTGVTSGVGTHMSPATTVDFSVAGDNSISIPLPTGFTRIAVVVVNISGASADISAANYGLFTATGGGGTALIAAGAAITVTSSADNTNNNYQSTNITNATTISITPVANTLYFRVGATAAAGRTGKVQLQYRPLP